MLQRSTQGSPSPNILKMRTPWATLCSLFIAIQPIGASYVPEAPNSAQPTHGVVASNRILGISPRITEAPVPDPRSLIGRADAYDRGTDTCGFYSDGYPLLCYASTATCAFGSKFAACCEQGTTCSSIFTGCYPFSDVMNGSCASDKIKTESKMACCYDRSAPNCVLHTLLISSKSLGIWGCATTTTGETVYSTNPFLKTSIDTESSSTKTTSSTSESTTDSTTTTPTSKNTTHSNSDNNSSDGEKKSNTGAIVGGVVGGVGGLAVIGAAIFFWLRYRKTAAGDSNTATGPAAQPMLQQPPPGQASPYGYHPSGSPIYDPNMAYQNYQGSPQPYPPSSQSPYDPRQSQQPSWGQPSPGLTTSPGPLGSTGHGSPGPQEGQAVELSNSNAVGTTTNRAELG